MNTRKKFYLAKSNQEGGTIENDFKEFSKYLMELIGATTDEELQDFVKKQGPEKVNEIYKQWKEQVPMAKDGMQFANNWAVKAQNALVPGNIAIRNKIQDTAQDDLRGISSFKEAFAEARRRGLVQFSWGKGVYTTELKRADPPPSKDTAKGIGVSTSSATATKPATSTSVPTPLQPKDEGSLDSTPSFWTSVVDATGAAGAAGALYYGTDKYVNYKAGKQRTAKIASAPRTTSAPKPSIFRNMGSNAKEYMSKLPFKEKVNEYTSKASNLFKRTSAPVTASAAASAPVTPSSAPKPEVKPKVTAPKSGGRPKGKSGKSFRPGRTATLAGKMAGRANMLGMTLGLISDLFPSKEDSDRSDAMWRIQKRMGYGYRPSEQELREEINPTIFKQGGKVNKLDYINKLNGECPEGFTAVKFAKGGVICTTCQKNKEVAAKKKNHLDSIKEELKCGGKMKSHQKGGEMTNAQYKKLPISKKVDQDLKDQAAGINAGEGGTPKTDRLKKVVPETGNLKKAAPKKLIKKPTKK